MEKKFWELTLRLRSSKIDGNMGKQSNKAFSDFFLARLEMF